MYNCISKYLIIYVKGIVSLKSYQNGSRSNSRQITPEDKFTLPPKKPEWPISLSSGNFSKASFYKDNFYLSPAPIKISMMKLGHSLTQKPSW